MAASKKSISVGILAEDQSDVEVVKHLLRKVTPSRRFGVKQHLGNGCGKLRGKCDDWARDLANRGCKMLFLVHDLDDEEEKTLVRNLEAKLLSCPIASLVVIPIREIEAWLLCDAEAIRKTFSLKSLPKCPASPESIPDPKGKLEELVWRCSEKRKRYLHTAHNEKIAQFVSILTLRKCRAFRYLEEYWKTYK
jgi:hypothetical protein